MTRHRAPCQNCGRERPAECYAMRCRTCQHYWNAHGMEHPLPIRAITHCDGTCRICHHPVLSYKRGAGRCQRCYAYWRRTGGERPATLDLMGTPRPCQVARCDRLERRITRGMCRMHYLRWWRRFGGKVA